MESTMDELPRPMAAEDVLEHPEYPHVTWKLEPVQEGNLPVAASRGGPFNIAYEVHGHGPIHLVWIMGMGAYMTAWQRQTKDFGHTHGDKYTSLIFDNRGIGRSEKPVMRYSTSEMAKDVIELLDHLGWTADRSIHIIGISMGGMIAQELGLLTPTRISTLTLLSTAPRIFNTVGVWQNLKNRVNLFVPRAIDIQLRNIKLNMFSEEWLTAPDESEYTVAKFPTNGDRFSAQELQKRTNPALFSRLGFIFQAIAAGWHNKSPAQLAQLAKSIGPHRIQVMHGTMDRMITIQHAELLIAGLGGEQAGITTHIVEGQGHVIPVEMRAQFAEWCETFWAKGEAMGKAE